MVHESSTAVNLPGRRGELTIGHLDPVVEDRPATVLSEHIAAARVIARYELPGPVESLFHGSILCGDLSPANSTKAPPEQGLCEVS